MRHCITVILKTYNLVNKLREIIMKSELRQRVRSGLAGMCAIVLVCPVMNTQATDLDSMESKSSELKNELDNINGEILEIGGQIAEIEVNIEQVNAEIEKNQEQLAIARRSEEQQYDEMKLRIQYIYENEGESWLGMIFTAQSLADFVNRVDFVQTMNEYDRSMVEELKTLRENIEVEEERLDEQQQLYADMEEELSAKKRELNAKAQETSTDLNALSDRIKKLKEEKAAEEARAAAKAAQEAQARAAQAAKEAEEAKAKESAQNQASAGNDGTSSAKPTGGYVYPTNTGKLNPTVGVVYFNGHKETYYSQRVLPGHGLNIPGRHVAADGTIRDANGNLCLASSDYPKGTVVETSLGTGVVYDSGCASGTIDIYTDW